jgi:hypothetical protein
MQETVTHQVRDQALSHHVTPRSEKLQNGGRIVGVLGKLLKNLFEKNAEMLD